MTVIMSLLMSLGICLRCGFNPTLNGSNILPYLVVVIGKKNINLLILLIHLLILINLFLGLENMLVMTKSVVSTPAHLDIKVRVAQGLSREGWSITKNLMTEITLLTFGFFTFVPIIQVNRNRICLYLVEHIFFLFFRSFVCLQQLVFYQISFFNYHSLLPFYQLTFNVLK